MINISIGPAINTKTIIANPNSTVREVYKANGLALSSGQTVTLNARRLGDKELDQTLNTLGVVSGDMIVTSEKLAGGK